MSHGQKILIMDPEGPSPQCLMFLVPETMLLMVFGTRDHKYWVLGPSGGGIMELQGLLVNGPCLEATL